MKKIIFILVFQAILISNISFSQYLSESNKLNLQNSQNSSGFKTLFKPAGNKTGASGGFDIGVGSVEGEVAFAIGAFAELKARDFSFVPQTNYWKAKKQTNFEIAGLIRFFLTKNVIMPYIDGGLGVNFYNSEKSDFTKMSVLAGGGIELTNVSTSFNLIFDGKYKLIVNDPGNISTFIFTAGMKFPFK